MCHFIHVKCNHIAHVSFQISSKLILFYIMGITLLSFLNQVHSKESRRPCVLLLPNHVLQKNLIKVCGFKVTTCEKIGIVTCTALNFNLSFSPTDSQRAS